MYNNLFARNLWDSDSPFIDKEKDQIRFRLKASYLNSNAMKRLKKLFPKIKTLAGKVKHLFSITIMSAARIKGNFNAHLSSPGSKMLAMRMFDLSVIKFLDEKKKKVLVDVFARTASIAFSAMGIFDEIYCGDKDENFVNYFNILRDYPLELIFRIKYWVAKLPDDLFYGERVLKKRNACGKVFCIKSTKKKTDRKKVNLGERSSNKRKELGEEIYNKIVNNKKEIDKMDFSKATLEERIDAAVCLLFWIRFSHYGYCEKFDISDMDKFIDSLEKICWDLIYTSLVLVDKKKKKVIKRGNYKKSDNGLFYISVDKPEKKNKNKGSVSPISYVHWDCVEAVEKHVSNPNAFIPIDGPFLRTSYGFPCEDYKDSFSLEQYKKLFRILTSKKAKAKVIVFHYYNKIFDDTIKDFGFEYVGSYYERNKQTCIYSLRIDKNDIFFDPKRCGKLYTNDSPNTQPDSDISSDKGV